MSPALDHIEETHLQNTQVRSSTSVRGQTRYTCRATQVTLRFDLLLPDEPVARDAEFRNFVATEGPGRHGHRLARAALQTTPKQTILDVYAYYWKVDGIIKKYPPARFGVRAQDLLRQNGAKPAQQVEK